MGCVVIHVIFLKDARCSACIVRSRADVCLVCVLCVWMLWAGRCSFSWSGLVVISFCDLVFCLFWCRVFLEMVDLEKSTLFCVFLNFRAGSCP